MRQSISIIRYFSILIAACAIFGIFANFAYAALPAPVPECEPGGSGYKTANPTDDCPENCIKIGSPAPGQPNCLPKKEAFPQYINMIYTLTITLSIILATIMIVYGGYRYMTSSGNPEALAEAKDIITGAIIGLVLLVLAALILRTISPSIAG